MYKFWISLFKMEQGVMLEGESPGRECVYHHPVEEALEGLSGALDIMVFYQRS